MKNVVKILGIIMLIGLLVFAMVACGEKKEETVNNNVTPVENVTETNTQTPDEGNNATEPEDNTNVPKNEQIGTAGSNIPLKDNLPEAEYQIKVAFQNWLVETYGTKVFDARIYVEKMYTAEEEQEIEALKERNLGPNEIAFEVRYELKPSSPDYVNELTVATGEYDEESDWITNKFNLGILRPNPEGDPEYIITDVGTGW